MAASIIAFLGALAAIILSILDSHKKAQEKANNARAKAQAEALERAIYGDPDGAVDAVLGMPDR